MVKHSGKILKRKKRILHADGAPHIPMIFGEGSELVETSRGMRAADLRNRAGYLRKERDWGGVAVICRYCLCQGTKEEFMLENKDYSVSRLFECPDCGEGMTAPSLMFVERLGPKEYSEWMWATFYTDKYASRRFKIDKLKVRVRAMGFSQTFWDVWRREKAGSTNVTRGAV